MFLYFYVAQFCLLPVSPTCESNTHHIERPCSMVSVLCLPTSMQHFTMHIRCLTTNKEKVESVEERSRLDQHSHGVESSVNVRRLYMQSGTSDILLHICYLLRVKGISGFLSAQGQGLSRETCLCCLSQSLYGNRSCCPLLGPPNLPLPPLPQSASQVP